MTQLKEITFKSSLGLDLNTVSDWYEDTQYEKYDRLDYLTNLGENENGWTESFKKEGHDGIIAGYEYVCSIQTKSNQGY